MDQVMSTSNIVQKYISLCKRYGVDIDIELTHGDNFIQKSDGNTITLNADKITETDFEAHLLYNIRKMLTPQIVLTTERLILRKFQPNDAKDCFGFLSDKQTCYSDGGYEPFAEMNEEYYALMDRFADQPMRKMIVLRDRDKVIGTLNISEVNDRAVEAYEIGYVINPCYQRKGYAFEAVSAICQCLLSELRADMIIAGAIESNLPSLNLLRKLDFKYEGRKTKSFYHPEHGAIDLLYYVKERLP